MVDMRIQKAVTLKLTIKIINVDSLEDVTLVFHLGFGTV